MDISTEGLLRIKGFEGLKRRAYRCSAEKWTLGYGHTSDVKEGDVITPEQAERCLHEDIIPIVKRLNSLITVRITQTQFDVLCSLVFNIGIDAFATSTLLKKLNEGNYSAAADEFPRWCHVTREGKKSISRGLLNRRQEEKSVFKRDIGRA